MNDLPKRKKLRLQCFDYSSGAIYFVTLCSHNRQKLFNVSEFNDKMNVIPSDNLQNKIVEKWLLKLQDKFQITIDKYVIMKDHIHLILVVDGNFSERHAGRSLQDIMDWFKTMTTNEYIKLVKAGKIPPFGKKIWQKSYYEHIIRNDDDYCEAINYIVNNPSNAIYKTSNM